jgi:hypothetical protein
MMDSAIEEKGSWQVENGLISEADALKSLVELAERLDGSMDQNPDQIFHLLKPALDRKDLRYIKTGGQIRWEWTDFLA